MQERTTGSDVDGDRRRWDWEAVATVLAAPFDSVQRRRINWRKLLRGDEPPRGRPERPRMMGTKRALLALCSPCFVLNCAFCALVSVVPFGDHTYVPCDFTKVALSAVSNSVLWIAVGLLVLAVCVWCLASLWCERQTERQELMDRVQQLEESNRELTRRLNDIENSAT